MFKHRFYYIALFLVAVFITALFQNLGLFERAESITYDWRVKALSKTKPLNSDISIIVVDQFSLDWMQKEQGIGWPWPREVYGAIIEYIKSGGAKAVAFDIIFSENSLYGNSDDLSFADALKQLPSVGAVVLGDDKSNKKNAVFPIDEIKGSFASLGFANAKPDGDGVIRRALLYKSFNSAEIASLPLALYKLSKPEAEFYGDEVIINYRNSPFSYDVYNAASIIQSWSSMQEGTPLSVESRLFKEKVVFIGISAAGLFDQKVSPLSRNHPGVDIQATILDNLIGNSFIKPLSLAQQSFYLLLFGLFTAILMIRSKNIFSFLIPVFIVPVVIFALGYLHYFYDYWLNITPLLSVVYLIVVLYGILGYLLEGRQKRYIQKAFSHYISPEIVKQLVDNPQKLKLGGESRELTIFFSDIWGFTTLSEQLEPQKLISMLHEYLEALSSIIMEQNGTIDKYEGDAIIAFWNAPLEISGHQSLAVKAALLCQQKLQELNPYFKEKYGVELKTRIGLHSGKVIVGNLGSAKHFDYSFIGDAGNLAARLEGVNKFFSTDILVSKVTRDMVDDISFRKIGTIRVVGRAQAVEVYQPLSNPSDIEKIEFFEKALSFFEELNMKDAKSGFEILSKSDEVSKKYLEIIAQVEEGSLKFDGAISLHEK